MDADTACDTWRDDMIDLTDEQFFRKYGSTKIGMWKLTKRESGKSEIRPMPNPEFVV